MRLPSLRSVRIECFEHIMPEQFGKFLQASGALVEDFYLFRVCPPMTK